MQQRISWSFLVLALILFFHVAYATSASFQACSPTQSELCSDSIDNDCDGAIDSADTECGSHYVGYGNVTKGGEGGVVLWADTVLGDPATDTHACTQADPCSFRKAVITTGPRVVKFTRGGTIALNGALQIKESFLTIDGFSSPSPGVTLTGPGYLGIWVAKTELLTPVHDLIFNHLRFTRTDGGETSMLGTDGEQGPIYNIIIDHIAHSLTHNNAGKLVLWADTSNVTVSNSLFYDSQKAIQIAGFRGGSPQWNMQGVRKITLFHNVFAHVDHRSPVLRGKVFDIDFENNIMYEWGNESVTRIRNFDDEEKVQNVNVVNNYYQSLAYPDIGIVFGDVPGPRICCETSQTIYGQCGGACSSNADCAQSGYAVCASDDGGPEGAGKCPVQGTVVSTSQMGAIWVSGNILPTQVCDQYSTVPNAIPVPNQFAVPAVL
ncbi:MAG: hypothetical protein Q7R47_02250, partial [Candidatus Diapherotrites archaeon]|nr:hypothetical protein [Candidatus Diapherotrites archaeon]